MTRPLRRLLGTVLALATILGVDSVFNAQPAAAHCSLGCEEFCHGQEYGTALCQAACPGATILACDEDACNEGWTDNACAPVGPS